MMSSRKRRNTIVKTIAITLIAGTISFAGDITISNADEVNTGVVKQCDFLNMRSGASTSNSVVGRINTDDCVQIIDKNSNGWYKIKTVDNVTGWVNGRYLTVSTSTKVNSQNANKKVQLASKTPTNQASDADRVGNGVVKQCDFLNMRSGASVSNSVVGKVNTGDSVQIIEKNSNGWYKIKTVGNVTGWVNGRYITESGSVETNTQNSSEKVQALLNLAYKQSGKPYKWGASGPSAFDCSGFTSYVYRNAVGVNLPRVSRSQANVGKRISKNDLKPGDLVFFGSGSISHVGIYVGDSKFIHSPQTGDVVKVSRMDTGSYSRRFISAARVLD